MVFESKNFIPTHSLFDSFQKDLKKDSPIQKGIHTQLSGKIIPFLKDASEKELISLYWESIKIKKIYGFVLTSGFIGIQKNPFENIRVISLDHTLEILDKEPVGKLFSDIDVLANYDYYLSVLHAWKMETMPPMSLPVLLEWNKAKEYTFQCPVFMMPELSH